ncbi:MAG: hypothetical protein V1749_09450 [Candidatus Desantisbacteria bacterium]
MMTSASEILSFNFNPIVFTQSAEKVFSSSLNQLLEKRTKKLLQIVQDIGESQYKFKGTNDIPAIFRKFKQAYKTISLSKAFREKRDLRTLTYSLSYSEQGLPSIVTQFEELCQALQLLKDNWRDSYIRGLTDCLFRNWETCNSKSLEVLRNFIISQLKNYTGGRIVITSLLTNIRFIEKNNGPMILGTELAVKGIKITQATSYLSLPENWIQYFYFSKVIDDSVDLFQNNPRLFIMH